MTTLLTRTLLVSLATTAVISLAGAQAKTATEFYLQYRQAFDKATKVEELLPYLAKARREEIEKTPVEERADMFEFMKILGTLTDLKVVGEKRTDAGYELKATAVDSDGAPSTGTILIVKEGQDWKVDQESWTSKG